MWVDFAIFVIVVSILMHFSKEFVNVSKIFSKIPGLMFVVPFILASFIIELFSREFYSFFIHLHHNVDRLIIWINSVGIIAQHQIIAKIIFVLLFSTLPLWVVFHQTKRSKYLIHQYSQVLLLYHVLLWSIIVIVNYALPTPLAVYVP